MWRLKPGLQRRLAYNYQTRSPCIDRAKGSPMRKFVAALSLAGLAAATWMVASRPPVSEAGVKEEAQIAHMVYFTLQDNSPTAKASLVAGCKKYLTKHTGEVFFRAGTRGTEFKRAIN